MKAGMAVAALLLVACSRTPTRESSPQDLLAGVKRASVNVIVHESLPPVLHEMKPKMQASAETAVAACGWQLLSTPKSDSTDHAHVRVGVRLLPMNNGVAMLEMSVSRDVTIPFAEGKPSAQFIAPVWMRQAVIFKPEFVEGALKDLAPALAQDASGAASAPVSKFN